LRNKKILITCGPTWVPIDQVRVISNRSTGQMGHLLTKELLKAGAKVTLLEGPVTDFFVAKNATIKKFYFYDDLLKLLKTELKKKVDIIIHAAAVSDYKPTKTYRRKLHSGLSKVNLVLVPTQKIIDIIRQLTPAATLVGFKLEPESGTSALRKKGIKLAHQADCDFVVANTTAQNRYRAKIINAQGKILSSANSRKDLARQLIKVLKDY